MKVVPAVDLEWLVDLVNGYAPQPRAEAGESDAAYPELDGACQPVIASEVTAVSKVRLAERLWTVFAANVGERVAELNALLHDSALTPEVDLDGRQYWATMHSDPDRRLAAGCTTALLGAVQTHGWDRLGICDGIDCVDIYIDQQGRTKRRYCSTTCLNRARVRQYRARHRHS